MSISLTSGRGWAWTIACVVFAAVAPTLTWPQFGGGSENLNVATVLEMHRGGPWVVPKLNGIPRLIKPPLTAWITAASVSNADVRALDTPDPVVRVVRERAYDRLAWDVRWPTLLTSCLLLVVLFEWGKLTAGTGVALVAPGVAASTLLFLRFGRSATTDVQLALWVTVCNAFFALALFRKKWLVGFAGAGAALGLALMSKGPVALPQTVLPFVVYVLINRGWTKRDTTTATERRAIGSGLVVGIVLMLAIALPWPVKVYLENPDIMAGWKTEITREGASTLPPDPWYSYLSVLGYVFPWTILFLVGLAMLAQDAWATRKKRVPLVRPGLAYAATMVVVPFVVMSFFKDKNERYQLPMLAPAALIVAYAAMELIKPMTRRPVGDQVVIGLQWFTLAVVLIGLPIVAATKMKTVDGQPWLSTPLAAISVAAGAVLLAAGVLISRWFSASFVVATVVGMLGAQALFMVGYTRADDGVSKLKPVADAILKIAPEARVYYLNPPEQGRSVPMDLNIYLNRVTPGVRSWQDVPNLPGPAVVVAYRRSDDPESPAPAGWEKLDQARFGNKIWYAFIRK